MIKVFYQNDIIDRLAAIFTYGLNNGYSYETIEERIISSPFVNNLEKNEYDIESKIDKVVESTFGKLVSPIDISFRGLFLGESYFRLFLHFNKSFEYLFLYWPLSNFVEKYSIYHEMDFSNLRRDFLLQTKETTLLRKLASKKQLKLVEISKLTGININTIDKYSRDDKYLYGASYSNIYKLSSLLKVKENIFLSSLEVYLDKNAFLDHESNNDYKNYLGLFFASYYDKRIGQLDFSYEKDENCFKSKNGLKVIVISDLLSNLTVEHLNKLSSLDTYLILIPFGLLNQKTNFSYLKEVNAFDIFVLTPDSVYILKENKEKEVTDTINKSLIIRASGINNLVINS